MKALKSKGLKSGVSSIKIEKIRIENFRCFEDVEIPFDDYTCFIGSNGSGKSTILHALNVFFRQGRDCITDITRLSGDDFHHKNTNQPIRITVTFKNLSEQAINDFSAYVRHGKLVVSSIAEFDEQSQLAEVKQYGHRLVIRAFSEFFEAEKANKKVKDLWEIFHSMRKVYQAILYTTTTNDMIKALRDYEEAHPEQCELLPSEDQFYGVSRGTDRLEKYLQWVYVPGAKNIVEEGVETKDSILGVLLERTVRSQVDFEPRLQELKNRMESEYQAILNAESDVLDRITGSLTQSLESWAHPAVSAQVLWGQNADKAIRIDKPVAQIALSERGFCGEPARFGHGLQRSFLLSLMQELSLVSDDDQPSLIMGIEEPELYQHPPHARHLAEVLNNLVTSNSQILACSHSPLFIPSDNVEAIRVVREAGTPSKSHVTRICYTDLNTILKESGQKALKETGIVAKLYPSLNPIINEMFFCKVLVLVEGVEDVSYIYTCLALEGRLNEFRKFGCHIVPAGGKNMLIKPIAIAKLLDIPTFVVCDGDTDKTRESEVKEHRRDNNSIQSLLEDTNVEDWPTSTRWGSNYVMWRTNMTYVVEDEIGDDWNKHMESAYSKYDNPGGLQKNPLAIAHALELAWNEGAKSASLKKLIDKILDFAEDSYQ